jgi:hypothetical protein
MGSTEEQTNAIVPEPVMPKPVIVLDSELVPTPILTTYLFKTFCNIILPFSRCSVWMFPQDTF